MSIVYAVKGVHLTIQQVYARLTLNNQKITLADISLADHREVFRAFVSYILDKYGLLTLAYYKQRLQELQSLLGNSNVLDDEISKRNLREQWNLY
jgi:hypothetical protein